MEIFDRLTNVSKTAAARARDMGERTLLSVKLAAEENRKNRAMAEIGRIFYETNQESLGSEYQPYLQQLREAEQELSLLREQLRRIRGIRCCASCGAELGRQGSFCGCCGAKNEPVKPEPETAAEEKCCPFCQASVGGELHFCPFCGEELTQEAPSEEANAPSEETSMSCEETSTSCEEASAPCEEADAPSEEASMSCEETSASCGETI